MKLIVKKDQDKGLLGGIKFIINAWVEVTNEEKELINKYKVHKEVLFNKTNILTTEITIGSLIDWAFFKCASIEEILIYEEAIKKSCKNLKTKLEIMKSFGGKYEIDFEN